MISNTGKMSKLQASIVTWNLINADKMLKIQVPTVTYHFTNNAGKNIITSTVEPRYLELAYFELLLISKWKSGPCFNMKLWEQVTK